MAKHDVTRTSSTTSEPQPSVSELLRSRRAEILSAWEQAIRAHPLSAHTERPALAELAPELLDAMIQGRDGASRPSITTELEPSAEPHVALAPVVAEYALLREAIHDQIERAAGGSVPSRALVPIDRTIDAALTRAVETYARVLAVDNARHCDDAQQAIRSRDDLLAIVSHDLRSPLSTINVLVSIVRDTVLDPQAHRQLDLVMQSVERIRRLLDDMLDTAVVQGGRLSLECKTVEASPLVADVVDACRAIAKDKQIAISHELAGELQIHCDPIRIAEVLTNLIGNAVQICANGAEVIVRMWRENELARFEVADTGPGIPANELSHVFEPYWTTTRRTRKGSGLGLYICKGIVEAHGGRIWAKSTVGVGTQMSFTLPLARPD